MQGFSIEGGNQPVDDDGLAGFLQSGNLRSAHPGLAAFQLNQAKVQQIGVPPANAEGDGVDDAGPGSARRTFKERQAPAVLFAQPSDASSFGLPSVRQSIPWAQAKRSTVK